MTVALPADFAYSRSMMVRTLLVVLGVAPLVGCGFFFTKNPPAVAPGPRGLERIAVQEPVNRTGRPLTVDEPGMLGKMLDEKASDVPEVLGKDLRTELANRGFQVVADGSRTSPSLRTEIRRWEPHSANYSMVTVDVIAWVVDPTSGREIWSTQRNGWNVPTRDAHSSREASVAASAAIARSLLEGWQPASASAPPATGTP